MSNQAQTMTLWGAIGPKGQVIKTSVGVFRAEAQRFAQQNKGFRVERLGELEVAAIANAEVVDTPTTKRDARAVREVAESIRKGPGRPRQYPMTTKANVADLESHRGKRKSRGN